MVSCTYNNNPKPSMPGQISQPLLVGNWKMETNRGVDVSFDIIDSIGKSWSQNVRLGYRGITAMPYGVSPITVPILKSPAGSIALHLWTLRNNNNTDVGNEILFYSLQTNSIYTELTGKLGYAVVFGLDNSFPPSSPYPLLDTINFKSPIVINKLK